MGINKRRFQAAVLVLAGCVVFLALRYAERKTVPVMTVLASEPTVPAAVVETGTHWANPSDYADLHQLGYQFVVTALSTRRDSWKATFDAAEANGLKLIAGLYPPPYSLSPAGWSITPAGVDFLKYAASRANVVKAVFVYNEPYWVNPFSGSTNICGALSAAELRSLRSAIRDIWPEAAIFHDIGQPGAWAPGGWLRAQTPCIADKYADATGVADYVGIWSYPFDHEGYHRAESREILQREISYVTARMQAQPIVDMQAFRCANCGEAGRWPSFSEMKDWNGAVRALGPHAVSWYPWRQAAYDDYLANHPEMWEATTAAAAESAATPSSETTPGGAGGVAMDAAVLLKTR
ncbi:MAG: hypothetical protein IT160_06090 [Bryobacterales bacterium]|nr:hypothetical protein [Bryobacterales bacterium]